MNRGRRSVHPLFTLRNEHSSVPCSTLFTLRNEHSSVPCSTCVYWSPLTRCLLLFSACCLQCCKAAAYESVDRLLVVAPNHFFAKHGCRIAPVHLECEQRFCL